jgi:hypothetical protein
MVTVNKKIPNLPVINTNFTCLASNDTSHLIKSFPDLIRGHGDIVPRDGFQLVQGATGDPQAPPTDHGYLEKLKVFKNLDGCKGN